MFPPCSSQSIPILYWAIPSSSHSYISPIRFLNHFLPLSLWRSSLPQKNKSPFTLYALLNSPCFPSLLFPRTTSSTLRISSICLRLKSSNFNFPGQTVPLKILCPIVCLSHHPWFHSFISICCIPTLCQEWLNNRNGSCVKIDKVPTLMKIYRWTVLWWNHRNKWQTWQVQWKRKKYPSYGVFHTAVCLLFGVIFHLALSQSF